LAGPPLVGWVSEASDLRWGLAFLAAAALSTAPRGYARDHARIELLRHKGLYAGRAHPWRKWVSTAEAKDRITADWRTLDPLLDWLDANVGGSSEWG
jgi:hypothetical protein